MTNESHTDWWNQYLESDDPDHVVVQMDKEIEQLRGNLSLAEEGLANAMQEIQNLQAQIERMKATYPFYPGSVSETQT